MLIFSLSNETWWFVEGIKMCIWASTSITEGKCKNFCYLCSCPTCHSECTVFMLLLHEPITYWMFIHFLDIFGWVKYFNMWRIIQGIHCWQDISGRGNWMCLFHLVYVAYFCLFHFCLQPIPKDLFIVAACNPHRGNVSPAYIVGCSS